MAKKLMIDLEMLNSTINNYEQASQEFTEMIRSLDRVVDTLRNSEWKSTAATAFFATYDDNWRVNMEKHILIIDHLRECLEGARTDYKKLADEAADLENALRI